MSTASTCSTRPGNSRRSTIARRGDTPYNLLNRKEQINYGGLLEGIGPAPSELTVRSLLLGALCDGLKALRTAVHWRIR